MLKLLQWLPVSEKGPCLIEVYMALYNLALDLSLWSCLLSPSLPPSSSATLPSLLLCQQAKHTLALGLLHLAFSLPGRFFQQILPWLPYGSTQSSSFLNATSSERPSWLFYLKSHPQAPLFLLSMPCPSDLASVFSTALNHHLTYIYLSILILPTRMYAPWGQGLCSMLYL